MNTQVFLFLYNLLGLHPFISPIVYFLGNSLSYLLVGGFFVYLFFGRKLIFKKRLFILLTSLVSGSIASICVFFIRSMYHSPRPFVLLKTVVPLINESNQALQSFPSNHAAIFFAIGTFIYFYHTRLGAAYLIAAIFISIARVVAGVHWPLDILAGATIGVASAHLIKWLTQGIKKNL